MNPEFRHIRVPESICPRCGQPLDGCGSLNSLSSPSTGDVSVCIRCGEVLEFVERWSVRSLPASKLMQIGFSDPKLYRNIQTLRKAILEPHEADPRHPEKAGDDGHQR